MLSRVAERIYWMGRYLERAENTARLINVYANLIFDLPKGSPINWDMLPSIMGGKKLFSETYSNFDEKSVCKFLLIDADFSGSVMNSVIYARENARTTREELPNEAWEMINELYLFIQDAPSPSQSRNKRSLFLDEVIARCQEFSGMTSGSMTRDDAYNFIKIGREIERADMTTRIIDTGATCAMEMSEEMYSTYEHSLWVYILDALGAEQMFRKIIRDRIDRKAVLEFLLLNRFYPRSVFYCLDGIEHEIQNLPGNHEVQRAMSHCKLHIKKADLATLEKMELHDFLDAIQLNFNHIHQQISDSWFQIGLTDQEQSA